MIRVPAAKGLVFLVPASVTLVELARLARRHGRRLACRNWRVVMVPIDEHRRVS